MNVIGIMILIQPAVLCLALGIAAIITGMLWGMAFRHLPSRPKAFAAATVCLIASTAAFAIGIRLQYGIPAVALETIRTF